VHHACKDSVRSVTCDGCSRPYEYVCWTTPEPDPVDPVFGKDRERWTRLGWF
jgi:hypothetical protein